MNLEREILLSVRNLVVQYPSRASAGRSLTAVRNVSLDVEKAGIYGLVGESGSGKSSLAHAIVQLAPLTAGRVFFGGQDLATMTRAQLKPMRRQLQIVFQDSLASLSPRRTILQTLLEPLNHFRIGTPAGRSEKAAEVLDTVGLDSRLLHRYPQELSGGQRQRVAIARALVTEPEMIIADEPLSSLDAPVQARIVELILDLRSKLGIAFLIVSHDLAVIRRLADTAGVMYLGKLIESGDAETLFKQPAHPYTQSLLAAVPVADPDHPPPAVLGGEPPSPLTPPPGCVFHKRCPATMTVCRSMQPEEIAIPAETGPARENQELKTADHRVRCHLWNATNT